MLVKKNPARFVDGRLDVVNPLTGQPFPDDPFDVSEELLRMPDIRRLFPPKDEPGGLPGGVSGDLIVVIPAKASGSKKGTEKNG